MNTGRLVGIILIITGLAIAVLAGFWIAGQLSVWENPGGTAATTAGVAFIPVALLVGFGIYLYVQGGQQAEQESVMAKQRQLLDILKSRGQVSVDDMALEMRVTAEQVKNMIHQLVGLQVFSGYVNWNEGGILYSEQASQLRSLTKCKNCGGEITLAGKGVVVCKYCGTEYFLS